LDNTDRVLEPGTYLTGKSDGSQFPVYDHHTKQWLWAFEEDCRG
jgi:hypothetical protein